MPREGFLNRAMYVTEKERDEEEKYMCFSVRSIIIVLIIALLVYLIMKWRKLESTFSL
jgi:hypothetical protein